MPAGNLLMFSCVTCLVQYIEKKIDFTASCSMAKEGRGVACVLTAWLIYILNHGLCFEIFIAPPPSPSVQGLLFS